MIGYSGRNERARRCEAKWYSKLSDEDKDRYNRQRKEEDRLFGWYFIPSMVPTGIFIYVISRFTQDPIIGMFVIMFFCTNLFLFCMWVIGRYKKTNEI